MSVATMDELFSVAIEREREANAFYTQVAARSTNASVREIFEQLAKEELGHQELIESFRRDSERMKSFDKQPQDFKVAEATPLPALSINMKPADAIALAMKKEQQAVEFYTTLAESTSNQDLKKAFERLANMETTHKTKLESVFVDIGYPEVF